MCEMASFVVTKTRVFWSKTSDTHEDIIDENKLRERNVRNDILFVRIEISPPNRNYRLPTKKWVYKLDQDLLPNWYDEKVVEKRCRAALKGWYKYCVVPPNKTISVLKLNIKIILGTVQRVLDGGTVQRVWGGGTVQRVLDGGTVQRVWDGGTVQEVLGGGTVQRVLGGGTVITYTPLSQDILKGANAVIVDRSGKTVVCLVRKTK